MANQLFEKLKNGLHNAKSEPPKTDTLAMGFTKLQIVKMDMKHPRLIWYDAEKNVFYDQGDSTTYDKKKLEAINSKTCKRNKPMKDLAYYVPVNTNMVKDITPPSSLLSE